jgi:fatty acid amide hydrolase
MNQFSTSAASELCRLSATEMARLVAAGQVSSQELVAAHIARIESVNPALNALVIPLFDQARRQAAAADSARQRGEALGPLHGVPVTIKECFHVAGTPSSEGIGRFTAEVIAHDGPLVARLRGAGAIVLGKTNLPQLMLQHETNNPVYGRTNNPWNLERSPGGSSGGEAALVAAGGSPLGLANDLGGSIRFPAHSCGLCGLKPTSQRLTNAGTRANLHGMEAVIPQPGPLARSVADVALGLRVLMSSDPAEIDRQIVPMPLGDPAAVRIDRLRVGIWTDDGFFGVAPALERAVHQAAEVLRGAGARVEAFVPPLMERTAEVFIGLIGADGAADAARLLGPSSRDKLLNRLLKIAQLPSPIRGGLRRGLSLAGQRRTAQLLSWVGAQTADAYWQMTQRRADYVDKVWAAWSAAGLDAVICPPHALPALRHGGTEHLSTAATFCYWANLLGAPGGVVPATTVQRGEESRRPASRDWVDRAAAEVERESAGLPVGVQVVGRPWREDVVLAVMQVLESAFSQSTDFPRTPVEPPAH